jgi:hypothetical protein
VAGTGFFIAAIMFIVAGMTANASGDTTTGGTFIILGLMYICIGAGMSANSRRR